MVVGEGFVAHCITKMFVLHFGGVFLDSVRSLCLWPLNHLTCQFANTDFFKVLSFLFLPLG